MCSQKSIPVVFVERAEIAFHILPMHCGIETDNIHRVGKHRHLGQHAGHNFVDAGTLPEYRSQMAET